MDSVPEGDAPPDAEGPGGAATGRPPLTPPSDPVQTRDKQVQRLLALLGGPVQFISMDPNKGGDQRVATFVAGDAAAADFVRRSDEDARASYYSLNVVRAGLSKKACKADLTVARGCHVDIDPPKGGGLFDADAVLSRLLGLPAAPTYIVATGNGLQAVWLFHEAVADFDAVEGISRRLIEQFDGDVGTGNIDRLLRVPGSLNTPNSKKALAGRKPVWARFA